MGPPGLWHCVGNPCLSWRWCPSIAGPESHTQDRAGWLCDLAQSVLLNCKFPWFKHLLFKTCVHSFWLIWANLEVLWQVNDLGDPLHKLPVSPSPSSAHTVLLEGNESTCLSFHCLTPLGVYKWKKAVFHRFSQSGKGSRSTAAAETFQRREDPLCLPAEMQLVGVRLRAPGHAHI